MLTNRLRLANQNNEVGAKNVKIPEVLFTIYPKINSNEAKLLSIIASMQFGDRNYTPPDIFEVSKRCNFTPAQVLSYAENINRRFQLLQLSPKTIGFLIKNLLNLQVKK